MTKISTKSTNVLKIQMFGAFILEYDGKILSGGTARSRQVWSLLEFLLVNRNTEFSIDALIDALWEEEIENPYNAIKNLVYRLRIMLNESLGVDKDEYIVFKHGSYGWNLNASYELDLDNFDFAYKAGQSTTLNEEERYENYMEVVNIYKGGLLSHSSYKEWAIPLSIYYQNVFMECIEYLCEYLFHKKYFSKVEALCIKAISIEPLIEKNHELLIKSYIASNKNDKALAHYYNVSELFYKELGIKLSDEINSLYATITSRENSDEKNINQIKIELKEAELNHGAVYCDYESFKLVYRIDARAAIRNGKSVFVVLINFSKKDNTEFVNGELKEISDICEMALINTLRKDDIVTRFCKTQYLVLLSNINFENAEKVLQKITTKINKASLSRNLIVSTQLETLDPVELNKELKI